MIGNSGKKGNFVCITLMAENKCKSLENLLPTAAAARLLPRQSPDNFEVYRNELHRK